MPLVFLQSLMKNWKVALAVLFIFGSYYTINKFVGNYLDNVRDTAILECNEDKLWDRIYLLEDELTRENNEKALLIFELNNIKLESEERDDIISELEALLENDLSDDGPISDRTREFYKQLNKRLKEYYEEDTIIIE